MLDGTGTRHAGVDGDLGPCCEWLAVKGMILGPVAGATQIVWDLSAGVGDCALRQRARRPSRLGVDRRRSEQQLKLSNRVALVTGAGRGIGRAIALALGAEGAKVAIAARTRSELEEVESAIRSKGAEAVSIEADLARRAAPARLASAVRERLGTVDILVNNAAIGGGAKFRPVEDFDDDHWDLTLALNLTAPYLLTKAILPSMLEREWGRVITVASINSKRASFHGCAYAASKHGVLGFMRSLALEVAPYGVTANCICPGPVETAMLAKRIDYDSRRLGRSPEEHIRQMTPMGGILAPEDIAPMAVYLASDDARAITG